MSSHSSCSDNADVPSHDSQYCLVQRVLLPCISDSGKIPARHPSVLCLFCSYAQLTDGCSFFPLTRTSLHQLMESYLFFSSCSSWPWLPWKGRYSKARIATCS